MYRTNKETEIKEMKLQIVSQKRVLEEKNVQLQKFEEGAVVHETKEQKVTHAI